MEELQKKIDKRTFLGNSLKLATAASALGYAGKTGEAQASASKLPEFIIDSHIHCGGTEAWVQEMVSIYRPRNAMACVLTLMRDMELMKNAIAGYPDVFIGYGYVDINSNIAIREIETFKKNGFVGMKFHRPEKNYDYPSYFQLYRLCEEYGMHMLFHTGASGHRVTGQPQWGSPARMRPMYLDTLCRQFPNVTIQGAHFGNPWYDEAAEAARWNAKLYFDITGSSLIKLIMLDDLSRLSKILWWANDTGVENPHTLKGGPSAWEHIVFGTDEAPSGLMPNIERFQRMLDENNVPENIRAKMWGLTIAEILGIDPRTKRIIR